MQSRTIPLAAGSAYATKTCPATGSLENSAHSLSRAADRSVLSARASVSTCACGYMTAPKLGGVLASGQMATGAVPQLAATTEPKAGDCLEEKCEPRRDALASVCLVQPPDALTIQGSTQTSNPEASRAQDRNRSTLLFVVGSPDDSNLQIAYGKCCCACRLATARLPCTAWSQMSSATISPSCVPHLRNAGGAESSRPGMVG